jgi:hypothetical protein
MLFRIHAGSTYDNVDLRSGAFVGIGGKPPRAAGDEKSNKTITDPGNSYGPHHQISYLLQGVWQLQVNRSGRAFQAFEVALEIVNITVDALESFENPIPAVNHVIVHRNCHKKWMGDHAPQYTAIHGQIIPMIGFDIGLCQSLAITQAQVTQCHGTLLALVLDCSLALSLLP